MPEKLTYGTHYWLQRRNESGYRSMYTQMVVVGETSRSYIVSIVEDSGRIDWNTQKIPKSLTGWHVGSREEAELFRWCIHNRYNIAQIAGASYDDALIYSLALKLQESNPWLKESLTKFQEGLNEKKSNQSPAVEVANSDGTAKA